MNKKLVNLIKMLSTILVVLMFFLGVQRVATTSNIFLTQNNGVVQQRDEQMEQLLETLRNQTLRDKNPEKLAEAIKKISDLRDKAEVAIPDLINLLTFKHSPSWATEDSVEELRPVTLGTHYPAINTLTGIGKPSLPALSQVIETEGDTSLKGSNALYVLQQIFRDDKQGAILYLEQKAVESSSEEGKQRLITASQKIKN